jgi:hypothetical protein
LDAYLDPQVRAAMSGIALLDQQVVEPALERLRSDLTTGHWHRRHTDLLDMDSMDLGYRLSVGGPAHWPRDEAGGWRRRSGSLIVELGE